MGRKPLCLFVFAKIQLFMETTKKTWGGARGGAGRKQTTVKRYAFQAPQEVCDILDTTRNKSAFICRAILAYAESQSKSADTL